MATGYRPSPAWSLTYEDGLLVLSAGADRLYGIDDLDDESAAELLAAWERGNVSPDALSTRARAAAEELLEAGAVESAVAVRTKVALRWVGRPDEELERQLGAGIGASRDLRPAAEDAELVLVVRTTGRLVEAYDEAEPISVPHLLLDVAYHHTVSIGPLVVAAETACLACLAGRIGRLWGDPPPPPRPALLRSPALAAGLAVLELDRAAAGDYRLAGTTAAYDVESHKVTTGTVYKLPWCPACGDGGEANGRIELPWSDR